MARDVVDGEIIESRDALAAWFEAGCKPTGPFRVGTEHEKILFYRADRSPVPYEGEKGIGALLEGISARLGWDVTPWAPRRCPGTFSAVFDRHL